MKHALTGIIAFAAAAPATGASAAVPVSAGEHQGYSRVVFRNVGDDVNIDRVGRIVRIRNLQSDAEFDFTEINDRRKAFRVLSAAYGPRGEDQSVDLKLNCDCDVRTSMTTSGKLIVDIVDPATPQSYDSKKTLKEASGQSTVQNGSEQTSQTAQASEPAPPPADELSIEHAHDRMVTLLKQAAEDGLITIRNEEKHEAAKAEPDQPTELIPERVPPAAPPRPRQQQAAITGPDASEKPAPAADYRCVANAALRIDGGPYEDDPLVRISDLQSELAEANATENKSIAYELAAGFLAIGFGEEALSLLTDYGAGETLLAEMARVVAERPLHASGRLLAPRSCDGAHALWQAAASDVDGAAQLYRRSNGEAGLLPTRLKTIVASRLAKKMIDAEAWDEAEELLVIAGDGMEELTPDLQYVSARLAERRGEEEASRQSLLEIASQNNGASKDALIALAESYAEKGVEPHEGFAEDIGALAKTAGSSRAAFAEAAAWANIGNVETAMMLLRHEATKSPANLAKAKAYGRKIFADALAGDDRLSQISALESYLEHRDWLELGPGETAMRRRIADVASEVGAPNIAFEMLESAEKTGDKNLTLKTAEAALLAGYPDRAIEIAAPFAEDGRFGAIVMDANIEAGRYHAALAAAASIADAGLKPAAVARAGWLARAWQSAYRGFAGLDPANMSEDVALRFALAAYKAGETTLPPAVDAVLSEARPVVLKGLEAIFETPDQTSALERSRRQVTATESEILMIEEILTDG